MSDISTQGPAQPTDTGSTNNPPDQGEPSSHSLASPFLEKVPQEHRSILEPYVRQWDAGVTRRFQELQGKFKPYEDLGASPEDLAQAWQIFQILDQNPKQIYDLLAEDFGQPADSTEPQNTPSDPVPGIPQEWQQRFEKQQQILEAIVDHITQGQQSQQETQEDKEFDEFLALVKQETGEDSPEFEDFFLAQLIAHDGDTEAALASWDKFKQGVINRTAKPTPPVLSGGGSPPQESQSVKDLSKSDVKGLVADLLSRANQEK